MKLVTLPGCRCNPVNIAPKNNPNEHVKKLDPTTVKQKQIRHGGPFGSGKKTPTKQQNKRQNKTTTTKQQQPQKRPNDKTRQNKNPPPLRQKKKNTERLEVRLRDHHEMHRLGLAEFKPSSNVGSWTFVTKWLGETTHMDVTTMGFYLQTSSLW